MKVISRTCPKQPRFWETTRRHARRSKESSCTHVGLAWMTMVAPFVCRGRERLGAVRNGGSRNVCAPPSSALSTIEHLLHHELPRRRSCVLCLTWPCPLTECPRDSAMTCSAEHDPDRAQPLLASWRLRSPVVCLTGSCACTSLPVHTFRTTPDGRLRCQADHLERRTAPGVLTLSGSLTVALEHTEVSLQQVAVSWLEDAAHMLPSPCHIWESPSAHLFQYPHRQRTRMCRATDMPTRMPFDNPCTALAERRSQ